MYRLLRMCRPAGQDNEITASYARSSYSRGSEADIAPSPGRVDGGTPTTDTSAEPAAIDARVDGVQYEYGGNIRP